MRTSAIVLAAGGSRRLGRPKQLLPYRGSTLLDATVELVRSCRLDQVIVALGGSADDIRRQVGLNGVEAVTNPEYGAGCSTSIRIALGHVAPEADGVLLFLGDQPGIRRQTVEALVRGIGRDRPPIAISRYQDGLGHPMWFDRSMFTELDQMHGDKAVWKLIHAGRFTVAEYPAAGPVPIDVDTDDDYQRLLAMDAELSDAH